MSTSTNVIEYRDLSAYLPHRFPFLLVDRVLDYQVSTTIRGTRNISSADPYWRTSPQRRYPAALIIESIGQLAGILYTLSRKESARDFLLGSIADVKILGSVTQAGRLVMEVWVDKELDRALVAHGWAETKEGKIVVIGRIIAAMKDR